MSQEFIYRDRSYRSILDIPAVRSFQTVRRKLYRNRGNTPLETDIVARQFNDGKTFLSYQGTTLLPGTESQFLAQQTAKLAAHFGNTGHFTAVDVGTGCGIFATYLAEGLSENTEANVIATDISGAALSVADKNFELNGLPTRPLLRQKDLLVDIQLEFGKVDLIVCNPPFTPSQRVPQNGFEPPMANDGGHDGTELYTRLLEQCKGIILENSIIVLQVTNINVSRIVGLVRSILPGLDIRYIQHPNTQRVCGIIVGNNQIVEESAALVMDLAA